MNAWLCLAAYLAPSAAVGVWLLIAEAVRRYG